MVTIDPRTGRVLGCHPVGGLGPPLRPRSGAFGTVLGVDSRYVPGATMKPVLVVASRSPFG